MAHDALEAGPGKLAPEDARKITGSVTRLSVMVAATLVVAKLVAWILSGSVAMLASSTMSRSRLPQSWRR